MKKRRMEKYRPELLFYLFLTAVCFLIIYASWQAYSPPPNSIPLDERWQISFNGDLLDDTSAPVYFSGGDEDFRQGVYRFDYHLELESSTVENVDRPALVFPYNTGNGIRVSLNGTTIGIKGDMIDGRASIWNIPHVFFVPYNTLKQKNDIKVELFSLYEAGFSKVPYMIDAGGSGKLRIIMLQTTGYLILFLVGSMFGLGLIFVLTGIFPGAGESKQIFLGFSLLFFSIFILDYSWIDNIGFRYLTFKRITVFSRFSAVVFFIQYVIEIIRLKRGIIHHIAIGIMIAMAVLSVFYSDSMVEFRKFYQTSYSINFPLLIIMIWLFFIKTDHTREMIIIFGGSLSALILSLHDIICLFIPGGQVFTSHTGMVLLFLAGALVMVHQILEQYIESVRQRNLAERFYAESVRDPLTGVYNRKIIPAIEEELHNEYSVILFDIDEFKNVNDTYGHHAGDAALKAFSKVITDVVRNNDYVVRLGGDEFIAVLPGCGLDTAEIQAERIRSMLDSLEMSVGGSTFSVNATVGAAYGDKSRRVSDIIREADKKMYAKKR